MVTTERYAIYYESSLSLRPTTLWTAKWHIDLYRNHLDGFSTTFMRFVTQYDTHPFYQSIAGYTLADPRFLVSHVWLLRSSITQLLCPTTLQSKIDIRWICLVFSYIIFLIKSFLLCYRILWFDQDSQLITKNDVAEVGSTLNI